VAAAEDEAKAETASIQVRSFTRQSNALRNFPDNLPRRRIALPAPTSCPCCGGSKLSKIAPLVIPHRAHRSGFR
jgi:transposase